MVVVFVATARGEVHADVGAARHLNPFAFAARLHKHRDGTCAVVSREVERHLVAGPTTFLVIEGDVGAVGQANLGVAAVALALDEEVDAAVGVSHAGQDVAVAVAIEAHAEETAPPGTVHVNLEVHDAPVLEVEVEIRRGLTSSRTAYA